MLPAAVKPPTGGQIPQVDFYCHQFDLEFLAEGGERLNAKAPDIEPIGLVRIAHVQAVDEEGDAYPPGIALLVLAGVPVQGRQ